METVGIVVGILTLLVAPAASISSNALDKSLIGGFSSVGDMKPKVVINFLGSCAAAGDIDASSCLVTSFIEETFGSESWGDRCSPFDEADITSLVGSAFDTCEGESNDAERDTLTAILSNFNCSRALCPDKAHLSVEATWIQSCAAIALPASASSTASSFSSGMFPNQADEEDIVLSCMIREAFGGATNAGCRQAPSIDASDCTRSLAPTLFGRCRDAGDFDSTIVMSMYTGFDGDSEAIQEDFCEVMTKLSDPDVADCFLPLCVTTDTPPTPTVAPAVSAAPSTSPNPTAPSTFSSERPSYSEAQSMLCTEILSSFTMRGIGNNDVPTSMLDDFFGVLGDSVEKVTADKVTGNVSVEILVVGSRPTRHWMRLLEADDALGVKFKATVEEECFLSNCTDLATTTAEDFQAALTNSIPTILESTIRGYAGDKNISVLKSVTVEDKSLDFFNWTSQHKDLDGGADSAAVARSGILVGVTAASLVVIAVFF